MERTPLDMAEEYQHKEVVEFLRMWMSQATHSQSQITATSLQWSTSQVTAENKIFFYCEILTIIILNMVF